MDEAEYCDRLGLIYRGELIALGTPEELKTRFMSEDVIEVLCDRPQEAMGYVEALPGIKHAALFGRGLHVVVEDAGAAVPTMARMLAELRFAVSRVEKIVPSLEDVFVSLIESRDRQQSPQREFSR
jgi:ABC-2 type transport system ATP-binding protein